MTLIPAYPLEDDRTLLHVAWSWAEMVRTADLSAITHIVHKCERPKHSKTLCGKVCYGGGVIWEFTVWSLTDDNLGVLNIGCKTCRRSTHLQQIEVRITNAPGALVPHYELCDQLDAIARG